jgi:hypothetical protein
MRDAVEYFFQFKVGAFVESSVLIGLVRHQAGRELQFSSPIFEQYQGSQLSRPPPGQVYK